MTPFVITTTSAYSHPSKSGTIVPFTTRRAVATLDAVRLIGRDFIAAHAPDEVDHRHFTHAFAALPEAGGSVGPLPDGTVIEVEAIDWDSMRVRAGRDPYGDMTEHEVIAAYNAAQGA